LICCVHELFFETAVRHPAVCCSLHGLGRQRAARGSAFNNPAKAKTVTAVEGKEGDAGAVFDVASRLRLGVGPASSKRWGDGVRKKGEDKQPHISPVWHPARSRRQISTDGLQSLSRQW